ncbi:MAG: hypothetical protein IJ449_00690 [Clostridia bacterium]|nr:hypothetical protein [Clostridia bacterium]
MNLQNFLLDVKEHAITHGSIPFWSWNDRLDEEELRRQIRVMHELGMNGFFMHARGGLETEYLSDEWFSCVDACVDEAKKYGMEAWSYDENGWPSGFAGGKLLEDPKNHATYLKYQKTETWPDCEHILGVYVLCDGKLSRVTAPVDGAVEYHVITQAWDSSYVDTLDAEITKKFLCETHDEYKKRGNAEDFGHAMPGFFTDEPQYYRWGTVWSDKMPAEFMSAYGYDVMDKLPALFIDFDGDKEFRYDYWKLCHKLFINHWVKIVYEWCEENGCRLTGHAVEETSLAGQMMCIGGVMPFYEYEHIPGIDYLGRGLNDDVAAKQLGSACAQLGKDKALSEMFGCCGWDVTPTELKRITELQYANGVNVMCQHLYAYSIRGQRKRDYPANYSEHLPWQEQMKSFDNYYNNLGYLLSRGEEYANTLVIHPIHAAYLTYKRGGEYGSVKEVEDAFHALSNKLSQAQIPYHWGDECMMAKMAKVEGDKIRVGLCTYDYIVIPSFDTIDASTVALLKEFLANGGKVWCYGDKPTRIEGKKAESDLAFLASTVSFEEIAAAAEVKLNAGDRQTGFRQMVRKTSSGRIVYAVNLNADKNTVKDVTISVAGAKGMVEIDLDTLEAKPVRGKIVDGAFVITQDFEYSASHVYLESEECAPVCPCASKAEAKPIKVDKPFTPAVAPENELTIDHFAISFDGGKTYSEQRPLECIRDRLLRDRYKGKVTLKAVFTVDDIPETLNLVTEPLAGATYTVNGKPLTVGSDWWLDRSFRTTDILSLVVKGENEIICTFDYFQRDYVHYVLYAGVSESLRNCLVFDTEIECMYLVGRFALKTPGAFEDSVRESCIYNSTEFAITTQDKIPFDAKNIVTCGYPFFAGTLKLESVYTYEKGGAAELHVPGRYAVCEVSVNGKPAGTLMFTDHIDLSDFLSEGENVITLALTNSNRNLMGPHHGHDPEPWGVGPTTFSMENGWDENNTCPAYVNRYAFVRFGIDG